MMTLFTFDDLIDNILWRRQENIFLGGGGAGLNGVAMDFVLFD